MSLQSHRQHLRRATRLPVRQDNCAGTDCTRLGPEGNPAAVPEFTDLQQLVIEENIRHTVGFFRPTSAIVAQIKDHH